MIKYPIIGFTTWLATILLIVGCSTLNPNTGKKEYDPVKTEQVEAAIEPLAAGGIRRVLENSPEHKEGTANYLRAVGRVFCNMSETGQASPTVLIQELDAILMEHVHQESYVIDVKNALVAIYKIFYADRFKAELAPDKWPLHVAKVICNSIDRGLKDAGMPGVL